MYLYGILIGCLVYMLTISKYFIKINVFIIEKIKFAINKLIKILKIPIKFLAKILRKVFLKPVSFIIINIRHFLSKNLIKSTKKLKKGINFKKKKEFKK